LIPKSGILLIKTKTTIWWLRKGEARRERRKDIDSEKEEARK
jgi:hypothetical protein